MLHIMDVDVKGSIYGWDSCIEYGVLFADEKVFHDGKEHEYIVHCYDGKAVGFAVDYYDKPVVYLEYPSIKDVLADDELVHDIKKYRGLFDGDDITFGDIMMYCGVFVNDKKIVIVDA